MLTGVALSLGLAAIAPQWLAGCAPLALFFGSASYTLCETRMLEDLAHAGQGHAFGRARKWGSFGFLAAASLGGAVLTVGGLGRSFTTALALCGLAYFGFCLDLARAVAQGPAPAQPGPSTSQASAPTDATPEAGHMDAPQGSTRHKWMGSGAIAGMRLAEAVSTTWFGAFWLSSGHSPLQTGLLCALPVAAEFLAMWRSGDFLARYSAQAMMLACCAISALRWLATPFCDALWCAVPLQAAHAFTFGFFYPASLIWLKHAFPEHFFQARYLTESLARALTASVSFLAASWVIAQWGYTAVFGTSCLLATLTGLWWWRVQAR